MGLGPVGLRWGTWPDVEREEPLGCGGVMLVGVVCFEKRMGWTGSQRTCSYPAEPLLYLFSSPKRSELSRDT